MNWTHIIWDSTPGGNIEHIEEHDLTIEEVDYVLRNPTTMDVSQSSSFPCVFGYTPDDRFIIVIYDEVDDETIIPITAYDVPEP